MSFYFIFYISYYLCFKSVIKTYHIHFHYQIANWTTSASLTITYFNYLLYNIIIPDTTNLSLISIFIFTLILIYFAITTMTFKINILLSLYHDLKNQKFFINSNTLSFMNILLFSLIITNIRISNCKRTKTLYTCNDCIFPILKQNQLTVAPYRNKKTKIMMTKNHDEYQ